MNDREGLLERVDLGAGGFALRLPSGERLILVGEIPERLIGRRVRVRGWPIEGAGFLMTGDPAFEVATLSEA